MAGHSAHAASGWGVNAAASSFTSVGSGLHMGQCRPHSEWLSPSPPVQWQQFLTDTLDVCILGGAKSCR